MFETQYEKELIINNRELKYQGVFRAEELFSALNRALEERGYVKREKKTEELVTEAGKRTYVELRPYKEKTNYLVLMLKIKIVLDNVTEKTEMVQHEKRKFQQGNVEIVFDSWILTDYSDRWNLQPVVFFTKALINKFLYKFPIEAGIRGEVVQDTAYIYAQLKKLLSSYKYEAGKVVKEEEVRKNVEAEIAKEFMEGSG